MYWAVVKKDGLASLGPNEIQHSKAKLKRSSYKGLGLVIGIGVVNTVSFC